MQGKIKMQYERKSIYIPKALVAWVNAQAKKKKLNFSSMITFLLKEMKEEDAFMKPLTEKKIEKIVKNPIPLSFLLNKKVKKK